MRSKVSLRIQDEMPEEVRIFVRQYTDVVLRKNEILGEKGYIKKGMATNCTYTVHHRPQKHKNKI